MTGPASSLALALAALVVGCERQGAPVAVDSSRIAIGKQAVRTDALGVDPACQPRNVIEAGRVVPTVPLACVGKPPDPARLATFVLVDADNKDAIDRVVTLGGVLVDGDGHEVGRLTPAALRIPAGGRRTFALVDSEGRARPDATEARVDVEAVGLPGAPETIRITDGEVSRLGGQVVASGTVENTTDRPAVAVVVAGFHDGDGRPLTRPFSVYELGPFGKKPAVFSGPPGSATGYIFVGQVEF